MRTIKETLQNGYQGSIIDFIQHEPDVRIES